MVEIHKHGWNPAAHAKQSAALGFRLWVKGFREQGQGLRVLILQRKARCCASGAFRFCAMAFEASEDCREQALRGET